jgi:hypothetical protein
MIIRKHTSPFVVALLILLWGSPALCACVSGQPASYDDVTAVMFERRACGGLSPPPKNPPLRCSFYRLTFWGEDNGGAGMYTQYSQRPDRGTYKLDIGLARAIDLLREGQFFLLNPGERYVTDMSATVLTVRRCGVTTSLMMFPLPDFDPKVNGLFADFDTLVERAHKIKLSSTPQDFQYRGVFEG